MELFSLLAKLTLNMSDFESQLNEAENKASGISIDDPSLGLDTSEFESAVDDAESTEVEDPEEPELGLDTSEFDQGVEDVEANSETFAGSLKSIFSELSGVLVGTGIVAIVSGVVSSLKEGVELAKNTGDAIDKQSQKMGISAEAYQKWDYALNLCGASITDLNRGLRTWQQAIGDDKKTAELAGAFESLGMDADAAMKKIADGDLTNVLDEAMYALADYNGADKGLIAETLFGKGATSLNALFNSTSAEIRDMKQEAEDLGKVMTDEEVKAAAEYMDATTRLESAIEGLKTSMVKDILPFLTEAANTVAKIVAFFNPRTGQKSLADQFADGDEKFAEELVSIEGTAAAAETLADKLLAMGETSKMTAEQYAIWKGTAEELIRLVPSLGDVINTETGEITANSEEIRENIRQWENLAKQKALQTLKEEKYQAIVKKNEELIDKSVEANKKAAEAEAARVAAAKKFSDKMQEYGLGSIDFTGDVDQQIKDTMDFLAEHGDEYESEALGLGVALKDYGEAVTEAGKAQAEADALTEELKKGEEEYQEWLEAAEAMYGIAFNEAEGATDSVMKFGKELDKIPANKTVRIHAIYDTPQARPFAIGSDFIPWDNFPALLHRGEKVLTATEARQQNNGNVNVSDLEDRIIAAIRAGMADANVTAVVTDRQVAKGSNRYNGNEMDARRFMP